MNSKVTMGRTKKRMMAMFLCVAMMMNGGISALADSGEKDSDSKNSGGTTVSYGDVSYGDVSAGDIGTLEVDATINDNGDNDDNTFELKLEAWVTGSKLDETAVLRNQISEYFDYYCACEGEEHTCIRVYTSDWDGTQFLDEVQIYPANDENAGEEHIAVTVDGKTVEVTGFNYGEHPVVQGDATGKGQKLVVKLSVETAAGFWGGNNVPVNEASTAVYLNDQVEKAFPILQANVPLSVGIATQDKTIYYGGSVTASDLLNSITAGYKTAGTTEEAGKVAINEDGTFTPSAEWMDDYAAITWAVYADREWTDGMAHLPENAVSKVSTADYVFTVNAVPLTESVDNSGYPGANEDGGAIAGTAVLKEGINASGTGRVYVMIPVITFKDTTIYRGFVPDSDYFNAYNIASVEWAEMTGCTAETSDDEDPYTYPSAESATEPELSFTFTPEYPDFITDTKVSVKIASSNDNPAESIYISDVAIFGGMISACAEGENGNEFNIVVEYKAPFELPATGGEGTYGYTFAGIMLIMAAVMVLYKKKQSWTQD